MLAIEFCFFAVAPIPISSTSNNNNSCYVNSISVESLKVDTEYITDTRLIRMKRKSFSINSPTKLSQLSEAYSSYSSFLLRNL